MKDKKYRPGTYHDTLLTITIRSVLLESPLLHSMAPLAPLVRAERPQEIALAEGRPIDIDEAEFGVCQLPQEKVGHALLPGGADHEVRVGHAAGVQVRGHEFLADVLQADLGVPGVIGGKFTVSCN